MKAQSYQAGPVRWEVLLVRLFLTIQSDEVMIVTISGGKAVGYAADGRHSPIVKLLAT